MTTTDERESMINDICLHLAPYVEDIKNIKNILYVACNKYEITSRCTDVAVVDENRNDELLKRFIIAKKVKGCTSKTIKFYATTLRNILQEIGKTVDDITVDDIRYYLAIRQQRDHVSKTTIGNETRNLSSFFTWLYAEEIIQKNPMSKVDRIKQDKTKKAAFTEIEIERLRLFARSEKEKMIIEVLLSTGCRVTELVNILLTDIDGERILVHGKGEKDRYVYLNAKAQLAIEVYLSQRKDKNPYLIPKMKSVKEMRRDGASRKNKVELWKDSENIIDGHACTSTIEGNMRTLAKLAGVEKANPHKFRRTCATMALRRGMPIEQVSRMLGHESIATTQIYLDLNEDDLVWAHKKYVI